MTFLLDTNICSAQIRGDRRLFSRFIQYSGRLHVSVICVAELVLWVSRPGSPRTGHQDLDQFLQLVTSLDVTMEVARKFGGVQAALMNVGLQAPEMDLMIGATALVHNLTLVTHNVQDFANIPELDVVDWLAA
jgi:tRNA(fMet)-specific endonuclease VapC